MHRPNESRASQQSRSALVPTRFLAPWDSFPEYNVVTVGNSGEIWTGAGGPTSFQNSISTLYYCYSDRYARAARMDQCFVLLSVHSMCNDAQSSLSRYNIQLSNRTGRLWWVTEQNKYGAKCGCDVLEGRSTRVSFFFFFVLGLSYHFKWQTVSNNFFFSTALLTVLTARC